MYKSFIFKTWCVLLLCLCMSTLVPSVACNLPTTVNHQQLAKFKQTDAQLYLTARQAYQQLKKKPDSILFVDVRTRAEIEFVGSSPLVDAFIPYMTNDLSAWDSKNQRYPKELNESFASELAMALQKKGLNKQALVIFICRAGGRSALAANIASQQGYTQAYSIIDGFEGDEAIDGKRKGQRVVNGWKNIQIPMVN